jgi:hypothetical protein|uniref:Uncharacterized protein n=1 Tax=Siphoviridae sp. ct8Hx23 TaxID=2825360 RepID=A0A8S5P947_9CAUD|nr:MAG TPA: hypothetical protein [Siphoviridae sp. ct8Hx23]
MALDLTQPVSGAVLESRGDGVIDRITTDGILTREQDVTEILRQNAEERAEDRFRGFRFAPTFRRVASIPVAVVDIAKAQGLDILNDPDAMRAFLNAPANAVFRTTNEVV